MQMRKREALLAALGDALTSVERNSERLNPLYFRNRNKEKEILLEPLVCELTAQ